MKLNKKTIVELLLIASLTFNIVLVAQIISVRKDINRAVKYIHMGVSGIVNQSISDIETEMDNKSYAEIEALLNKEAENIMYCDYILSHLELVNPHMDISLENTEALLRSESKKIDESKFNTEDVQALKGLENFKVEKSVTGFYERYPVLKMRPKTMFTEGYDKLEEYCGNCMK